MAPVSVMPVTVKVNVPLFFVHALLKVAVPAVPVWTLEVPDVRPDHFPVTVAFGFTLPAASLMVTTAADLVLLPLLLVVVIVMPET